MKVKKTINIEDSIYNDFLELVAKRQRRSVSNSIEQVLLRAIVAVKREQLKKEQNKSNEID